MPDMVDDPRLLLLSPRDNVLVAREAVSSGSLVHIGGRPFHLGIDVERGHKVARQSIAAGDLILKYGAPIGTAIRDIAAGEHVHVHNIRSNYTATHLIDRATP
jgi:predicted RecA/RadA family phage recombinase